MEPLEPITPAQLLALRIFVFSRPQEKAACERLGITSKEYHAQLKLAMRHAFRECAPELERFAHLLLKASRWGIADKYLEKMPKIDMSDPLF